MCHFNGYLNRFQGFKLSKTFSINFQNDMACSIFKMFCKESFTEIIEKYSSKQYIDYVLKSVFPKIAEFYYVVQHMFTYRITRSTRSL